MFNSVSMSDGAVPQEDPNPISVWTLVLWLVCFGVGMLGFVLPYEHPRPLAPEAEPVVAQHLKAELTPQPLVPQETPPPALEVLSPPPPPEAMRPVPIVRPIAVALPTPAIEFALPVEAPTRSVALPRAEHAVPAKTVPVVVAAPAAPSAPPAPSAQPLIFGEGEGKQPAPEYPRQAVRQGQEGTVLVRLKVDGGGRVVEVQAAVPSPWTLLNQAALRVVRERWRFREGPHRSYEVAIRFELAK